MSLSWRSSGRFTGEPVSIPIKGVEGKLIHLKPTEVAGDVAIQWFTGNLPCNSLWLELTTSGTLSSIKAEKEGLRIARSLQGELVP